MAGEIYIYLSVLVCGVAIGYGIGFMSGFHHAWNDRMTEIERLREHIKTHVPECLRDEEGE